MTTATKTKPALPTRPIGEYDRTREGVPSRPVEEIEAYIRDLINQDPEHYFWTDHGDEGLTIDAYDPSIGTRTNRPLDDVLNLPLAEVGRVARGSMRPQLSALLAYADRRTLPELNVELLKKALEFVTNEHDLDRGVRWNQGVWGSGRIEEEEVAPGVNVVCATACCVAGWVGTAVGAPLAIKNIYDYRAGLSVTADNFFDPRTEELVAVEDFAIEQLGITAHEADLLFEGTNLYGDVIQAASHIAWARGIDPSSILPS